MVIMTSVDGHDDLVWLPSALKRGYSKLDMLHVMGFAVRVERQADGMAMYIGADTAGRVMEVGTITLTGGQVAVAHSKIPPTIGHLPTKANRRRK